MKTYHVELKRVSYVNYEVEANTPEEAEDKAWKMLETDDFYKSDAYWDCESIEEVNP